MPFVRPVTVALVAAAPTWTGVCAVAPMYGVTVWPVIGLSPSAAEAVHVTRADTVPGCALTAVGAAGATGADGVTGFDCAEAGPSPFGLVACTVKR